MAKRGSKRPPETQPATAGAVAHQLGSNTAVELAAWANASNKTPSDPTRGSEFSSFAPGLQRLQQTVRRASDPDDTANDLSLMPGARAAAPTHRGPVAIGSAGRERVRQALDMREARADDEGTPHVGPLALGSPGRARLDRSMATFNQANRHYQDSHMQSHAPDQPKQPGVPSGKPRGFQIHKVQAAAQRAKGNQYTGPDDDGAD
jgi:hypothetical protein